MMINKYHSMIAVATAASLIGSAGAEDLKSPRTKLDIDVSESDNPVAYGVSLTTDYMYNASGGLDQGDATAALLEVALDFNLEDLVGLQDTHLHFLSFSGFGTDLSERFVGDQSVVSNIYSPYEFNIFHLYVQHDLSIGHDSVLKIGQMAADDEFMGADAAGLFINSSFGPFNTQSSNTPSPIFPLGAPGVFGQYGLTEDLALKAGVYAGDAGGADLNDRGFDWRLGGDAGYAAFLELAYDLREDSTVTFGAHYHSGDFTDYSTGAPDSGFGFVYTTINHRFDDSLTGFARASVAVDEDKAAGYATLDGGLIWEVLPNDGSVGIGVSHTEFGDAYVTANPGVTSSETILELTALMPLTESFSLQPDLQYIANPHGSGSDAVVAGVRAQLSF